MHPVGLASSASLQVFSLAACQSPVATRPLHQGFQSAFSEPLKMTGRLAAKAKSPRKVSEKQEARQVQKCLWTPPGSLHLPTQPLRYGQPHHKRFGKGLSIAAGYDWRQQFAAEIPFDTYGGKMSQTGDMSGRRENEERRDSAGWGGERDASAGKATWSRWRKTTSTEFIVKKSKLIFFKSMKEWISSRSERCV